MRLLRRGIVSLDEPPRTRRNGLETVRANAGHRSFQAGDAMSYQVLARKWRPQTFSALIGQEAIVQALRNALKEDRIAQAYLFSGIRGVGKTTAARLLAKALNCERGPAEDPCNECDTCKEITAGGDLDVIEVDAATYSKVEQVRELTESLKYGPARDRYKVVVLDEIHRLSRQAFDALLKIVEEPPPHLTFIFATTEIEAVPATILSRCQEFHFRRVPTETLVDYLGHLCAQESIEASPNALHLIARASEGSVRDAVALLDQLATFGSQRIDDDDAMRLLGGLDASILRELLDAILRGDAASVSEQLQDIEHQGRDPRNVFTQFLAYLRSAAHAAQRGASGVLDLPTDEAEKTVELSQRAGYEAILRLLHLLLTSESLVRRSDAPALALEVVCLRAAELPKLLRVEQILKSGAAPASSSGAPTDGSSGPAPETGPTQQAHSATIAEEPPEAAPTQAVSPSASQPPPTGASEAQHRLLRWLEERRPPLAAHLRRVGAAVAPSGELVIRAPHGDLVVEAVERAINREHLDSAVAEVLGESASWRLETFAEEPAPDPSPPTGRAGHDAATTRQARAASNGSHEAEPTAQTSQPPNQPSGDGSVESHPTVKAVIDIFGGRIQSTQSRPQEAP